ncbi:hypothetical protein DRW03_15095 [Corallococcus sp. H22C18031201]|uniref:hypothetical protein n=1 Tax=Citreicoccus inhibens TaxID=2849499 RepID=UPI000E70D3D7|nr:hypothetical protein [Citreicoccus inhibens]MBU8895330.1 hypothetical protein [Citreicoccus inhibens]RJS22625.1 hypothetical protein DRW03_15095 [Corallococcus sp. H22C18031201]
MSLRSVWLSAVAAVTLLAPWRAARACGPDFPPILLNDRARTLAELPEGSFALEASRLVPPPEKPFPVIEDWEEPKGARVGGGAQETQLYESGAAAFKAGDSRQAYARFQAVLDLPPEQRRRFSTFARYMLGRTSGAGFQHEAIPHFRGVRELARQGFEDPLGLALASLGEEARLLLDAGDDAGAIRLYAEQAAHGSHHAATSLLLVARALTRDPARLQKALKEPVAQRLMAAYVWTRAREWESSDDHRMERVARTLDALAAVPGLAGADRLAAAAWRAGRFEQAERFAGLEHTPLSTWVRAKLALRRGDAAEAERLLAEASAGIPATEDWTGEGSTPNFRPHLRLEGERAVLALAQGDFARSAEALVETCYWPDVAEVAERVLTVEELKKLVATHAPSTTVHTTAEQAGLNCTPFAPYGAKEKSTAEMLRRLLARRLLRTHADQEAQEYFRGTEWEQPAREYADLLARARSTSNAVDKAQALYAASRIARRLGMELLGTEASPDWAWTAGDYSLDTDEEFNTPDDSMRDVLSPVLKGKPLLSDAERARRTAHAPPSPLRFHYRATAADLAEEAAALMPPRSQAYAMLLCHAARYTSSIDPERGQRLWRTYIQKGASIPGTWQFGQACPDPDFARVRASQSRISLPWKNVRRRTLAAALGGGMLPLAMGAALWLRRRRQAP